MGDDGGTVPAYPATAAALDDEDRRGKSNISHDMTFLSLATSYSVSFIVLGRQTDFSSVLALAISENGFF